MMVHSNQTRGDDKSHSLNDGTGFILTHDHESFSWLRSAGHPEPTFNKALVWVKHDQVQ